jgi:hypothetical protein
MKFAVETKLLEYNGVLAGGGKKQSKQKLTGKVTIVCFFLCCRYVT